MKRPIVLFATDFSEPSDQALQYAAVQARGLDAQLVIVHVRQISAASGEGMLHAGVPIEGGEEVEARLRTLMPDAFDGPVEHYLLEGDPAREIVKFAEKQKADLVVLGSHGRTGLARVLMGSVAEHVVRHCPCPVLVVKQPDVS